MYIYIYIYVLSREGGLLHGVALDLVRRARDLLRIGVLLFAMGKYNRGTYYEDRS